MRCRASSVHKCPKSVSSANGIQLPHSSNRIGTALHEATAPPTPNVKPKPKHRRKHMILADKIRALVYADDNTHVQVCVCVNVVLRPLTKAKITTTIENTFAVVCE